MNRILPVAALLAVLAAAWAQGGGCLSPLPGFEPDPEAAGQEPGEGGAWTFISGRVAARLTPLDDASRLAFLKDQAGAEIDPFAGRPGEPPPFITFHLVVANDSPDPVVFEPQKTWLVTNKGEVRVPLDRYAIGSAYRVAEAEMPPSYDAAAGALLSNEAVLARGQRVAGLLVYRPVKPKTRWFRVEIRMTDHEAGKIEFQAAYRKIKKKKDGK
jgi:hypothetical protein